MFTNIAEMTVCLHSIHETKAISKKINCNLHTCYLDLKGYYLLNKQKLMAPAL